MVQDMSKQRSDELIEKAEKWFKEVIVGNHITNTKKLSDPNKLNINPFLALYLANAFDGSDDPESISKAILLPRVLGTSINTSFGQNLQKFICSIGATGSAVSGIDVEFIDAVDGRRKYAQLKLGPNTINKDDVKTIADHFKAVINLSRTNSLNIPHTDMIVGVLYGEPSELSNHYQAISQQHHFPVHIGKDFWHRLTGDDGFYESFIEIIKNVSKSASIKDVLDETTLALAQSDSIQSLAKK
jgi:hypothetical protein